MGSLPPIEIVAGALRDAGCSERSASGLRTTKISEANFEKPSRICGNVLQHFSEMFSTRIRTPNGQRALEREDMALASRYPVSRSTMYGGWHASTSLQHRLPPAARLWGDATRAPGLVVLVLSRGGSPAGHFEHLR